MNVTRRACLSGVPFLFLSGCLKTGDTVRVDVFVAAKTTLREVYVDLPPEKNLWPTLAPDERGTFQVRLMDPQIATVRYRVGAEKREWKSPPIDPYTIRVVQLELSESATAPVTAKLIPR